MAGNVFYRSPEHDYAMAVRGEGVYLYDATGKQYLDGSGGAAVSCLGHGNHDVVSAVQHQIGHLAYAHTAFFTNEPQEELAARVATRFGEQGARVYFVAGGSEANETAIKLARQYWVARNEPQRTVFISRNQSYHGNTLGALALSGSPGRRKIYNVLLNDWPKIAPCYPYRRQEAGESDDAYSARCANALEEAILESGAENVAAFVAETVAGATVGAATATEGYFRRIREICDRYGILLILDEVMCGSGRTGTYFAFEREGVLPDIVTLAKGLGGGYQPIGATISRSFVHDQIAEEFGEFTHGYTYQGHATSCAAGVAVQNVLDEQDLLKNVNERGAQLRDELASCFSEHPYVGDIRGRGLFVGIELVTDRETKAPPGTELGVASWIKNTAMEEGLICYPAGGTADGKNGAHILLAPPFIYTAAHVSELVGKLESVLGRLSFD